MSKIREFSRIFKFWVTKYRSKNQDKLRLSVHISRSLQNELDFLAAVDQCPVLSDPSVLSNAVRRYESLWLPLISDAAVDPNLISPPLDVHWIWHCHMLSPYNYQDDCKRLVGKVVDHIPKSTDELIAGRQVAAIKWKNRYPTEPFDSQPASRDSGYERRSTYDLAAAAGRQSSFYYNVSLPHYRDKRFLATSIDRYKKFLFLKLNARASMLIPCYDIDLVWHTHQLHPVAYEQDTVRILGRMLNHDDTIDDRTPGSVQQQCYMTTKQLWSALYGWQYPRNGVTYRGICSKGKLPALNLTSTNAMVNQLQQLRVSADPETKKVKLQLHLGAFQTSVIPENIEQPWGPIQMQRLPPHTANTCQVATHPLVNESGALEFTVRVIHSIPLHMSAVHVFQGDRLIVVSHLVGTDQLPSSSQLKSSKIPHLDFSCGERAMIIKDNVGDYGIVVGKWNQFRKGVPGDFAARRPGIRGNPGFFQARYYPLRTSRPASYQVDRIPTMNGAFSFSLEDAVVNLKSGELLFGFGNQPAVNVAQNCCLAMTISILYVLCQPRPPGPPTKPTKNVDSNGLKISRIDSESAVFIVAAGYLTDTPRTIYDRANKDASGCIAACSGGGCGGCGGCGGGCGGCGGCGG